MEFLSAHPQLDIDLDLNDRQVDLVGEGYDIAIWIGKLADSSLIARTLAPCQHVVCASPAYLAVRGLPATPADLAAQDHDCLIYSNRPVVEQWRFRVAGEWKEAPVTPRRLGVNNGDALCEAGLADLGFVLLPTFIVSDAVAAGDLRIVLANYEFFDPSIHAILAAEPPTFGQGEGAS